jgi:hypothetical protein
MDPRSRFHFRRQETQQKHEENSAVAAFEMPENSHRQKYNGFSFAFRLTQELRITEKKQRKMDFHQKNEL